MTVSPWTVISFLPGPPLLNLICPCWDGDLSADLPFGAITQARGPGQEEELSLRFQNPSEALLPPPPLFMVHWSQSCGYA